MCLAQPSVFASQHFAAPASTAAPIWLPSPTRASLACSLAWLARSLRPPRLAQLAKPCPDPPSPSLCPHFPPRPPATAPSAPASLSVSLGSSAQASSPQEAPASQPCSVSTSPGARPPSPSSSVRARQTERTKASRFASSSPAPRFVLTPSFAPLGTCPQSDRLALHYSKSMALARRLATARCLTASRRASSLSGSTQISSVLTAFASAERR